MKKIKSVKLLKDLPGCKAGMVIEGDYDKYIFLFSEYFKLFMKQYPDFFEITYEEEETVHILLDVEVRKDYYSSTLVSKFKDFHNEKSLCHNPIISVEEITDLGAYKIKLEESL